MSKTQGVLIFFQNLVSFWTIFLYPKEKKKIIATKNRTSPVVVENSKSVCLAVV